MLTAAEPVGAHAGSTTAPAAPAAASGSRILFLVVVSGADLDCLEDPRPAGPRYTRDSLRNLLQLLGCKPRLAYKIMLAVFTAVDQAVISARQQRISRKTFQVHPHRNGKVYVSLTRADFMLLVSTCAAQYSYKISPSSDELKVACSLRERRRCVVVLLCGTSGSGKSTLASILAGRLGITTVISTDSIRHMLRSFSSRDASPLLWASTYQAGEFVRGGDKPGEAPLAEGERTLCGYKAQCELLAEQLEVLIAGCEARQQSLICEGVHLNISCVLKLMSHHPDVLPFLVHIASEDKHVERMAVRAKYMTLDPNKNRYVRYMGNIRLIQEYLVRKADKHAVPRVENTNVDRSVGIIHLTVMGCLRRMAKGEPVLDHTTGSVRMLAAEYAAVLEHLQGERERAAAAAAAAATAAAAAADGVDESCQAGAAAAVAAAAGSGACSSSLSAACKNSEVWGTGNEAATAGSSSRAHAALAPSSSGGASSSSKPGQHRRQGSAGSQGGAAAAAAAAGGTKASLQWPSAHSAPPAAAGAGASSSNSNSSSVPPGSSSGSSSKAVAGGPTPVGSSHDSCGGRSSTNEPHNLLPGQQAGAAAAADSSAQRPLEVVPHLPGPPAAGEVGVLADGASLPRLITASTPAAVCLALQAPDAAGGLSAALAAAAAPGGGGTTSASPRCAAVAAAAGSVDGVGGVDAGLVAWSPEGPVLRWDRLLQDSRLSPGDELLPPSPVSPLAAAGLAMRYPRSCSNLAPAGAGAGGDDGPTPEEAGGGGGVPGIHQWRDSDRGGPAGGAGAGAGTAVSDTNGGIDADDGNGQAAEPQDDGDGGDAGSSEEGEGVVAGRLPPQGGQQGTAWDDEQQQGDVDLVSSGEELDELGELGSSDNEGERFLQEYGSMNESTTCDEHDEDEHDFMGAGGLRAWNAGMARALWPSYSHVYNSSGSSRAVDVYNSVSNMGVSGGGPGGHSRPLSAGAPGGSSSGSRGYRRSISAIGRSGSSRSGGRRRWSGAGVAEDVQQQQQAGGVLSPTHQRQQQLQQQ